MSNSHPIMAFNSGILSPKLDTRADIDKYQRGCRILQNIIATKYGGGERRGGLKHIDESYNSEAVARVIEFIYSASVAYKIEMVNGYFRFFYDDAVLLDEDSAEVVIDMPYTEADLFEIQSAQIGDIMWMVHPSNAQQKLSRTDPYTFSLDEIDFRKGPFLLRNDLLDLTNLNPSTMTCSTITAGQIGTLVSTGTIFQPGHKGALFKLTHPRENTIIEQSGQGESGALPGKGTFTVVSRGTWTGTFYVQRKEQNADWENFRSYKGNANRNVIESWKEEEDNVQFRVNAPSMDAPFRAEISIQSGNDYGIVKVLGVGDANNAVIEVYKTLQSTDATKRWAEGAWSDVRGYPSAITFFENRCLYAGATTGSESDTTQEKDYPSLLGMTY